MLKMSNVKRIGMGDILCKNIKYLKLKWCNIAIKIGKWFNGREASQKPCVYVCMCVYSDQ